MFDCLSTASLFFIWYLHSGMMVAQLTPNIFVGKVPSNYMDEVDAADAAETFGTVTAAPTTAPAVTSVAAPTSSAPAAPAAVAAPAASFKAIAKFSPKKPDQLELFKGGFYTVLGEQKLALYSCHCYCIRMGGLAGRAAVKLVLGRECLRSQTSNSWSTLCRQLPQLVGSAGREREIWQSSVELSRSSVNAVC